ncbi:MAG TPA: Sec-independent protein translocase protein TatB [Vineibacter sp.]|nr:Sec-independent protein translocase protein TatB [Vineibacter sp.]
MFGIDAPELLIIALVALIFIGPKELPGMLRSVGKWMATARNMAGEFRGHVDDMMRQAELDELKKQVEEGAKDAVLDLQALDPTREIKAAIEDGTKEAQQEIDQAKAAIDSTTTEALPAPAELAVGGDPMAPAPADADVPAVAAIESTAIPAAEVADASTTTAPPTDGVDGDRPVDRAVTSAAEPPPAASEPVVKPPQKVAVG